MNSKRFSVWIASILCAIVCVLGIVMIPSCTDVEGPSGNEPQTATLSGTISVSSGSQTVQPLSGVTVAIKPSFSLGDTTLTNAQGAFSFTLQFPGGTTSGSIRLTASKTGYFTKVDTFSVQANNQYTKQYTMARRDSTSDTTQPPIYGLGGIASLVFVSASSTYLNVRSVGGVETTTLTFEARDSSGRPVIVADTLISVNFRLAPGVDGGEYLSRTSAALGLNGRVSTTINAGIRSGIIQVEAKLDSPSTVRTSSPAIPIYSGPPDPMFFSMAATRYNFPALGIFGSQDTVVVHLGDRWSNPVRGGTNVYFSTRAGVIQPVASTNADGKAQAVLFSGNPQPADGFGYVIAQTIGDSGRTVQDSVQILLSGKTQITVPSDVFTIQNSGYIMLPFRVFDENHHPLAQGTHIQVSVTGDAISHLAISGDLDRTLPDTKDSSYTFFNVYVRDTSAASPRPDMALIVTVTVNSPNGNVVRSMSGILRGGEGTVVESTKPASISVYSISSSLIAVKGSGGTEASTVTFVVLDRRGKPIPQDSALVWFELQGVNATLYPASTRTDAQGRVQTTVTSGTIAGVVQVVALTDTGGPAPVKSSPIPITIAGGLPDSSHFTIAVEKFNIPGLIVAGVTDVITVYVGDQYGNPVQQNTAVYFTTNGGLIVPAASTNNIGVTTATLVSGEPAPPLGWATITARTLSASGGDISRDAHVVFSGYSIVTAFPDSVVLDDGGTVILNFSIKDFNGNPIAAGNRVQVALNGGPITSEIQLSGDISFTTADRLAGGTDFAVVISDKQPLNQTQGYFTVDIGVSGPNGIAGIRVPARLKGSLNPPIKSIVLDSLSTRLLTVRNTGERDSTSLVFEIRDAQNNPIPVIGVPVDFLVTGVNGSFNPSHAYTNNRGQVRTTFYSGSEVGTANLVAQVGEISSAAVNVTILAGPPYVIQLTPSGAIDTAIHVNYPGAASGYSGIQIGETRVIVVDRYNNPITAGSRAINFATNAGTFPNTTAYTNKDGLAKVGWYGGAPLPSGGNATITVSTTGEYGASVAKSAVVTYSGNAAISTGFSNGFVFAGGIDTAIAFTVSDSINGNPLSKGARIKVTSAGAGSVLLSGDTLVTMPDTRDVNATMFSFRLRDTNTVITNDRPLSFTIQVSGPNGTRQLTVGGTLKGATPPPFRVIALESINPTIISVMGVGLQDSTALQYVLQDSAGHVIPKANVPVNFFVASGVDGSFSPALAYTDATGHVLTTFHSGTLAGTTTVKAQSSGITSAGQSIIVEGGPPSQMYFALRMLRSSYPDPKVNFPGALPSVHQQIGTAQISAKDRYGNAVKSRTAINIASNAGSMQTTAYTDNNGIASASWYSGTPIPAGGNAHIVATALGEGAATVADSADVLYSGQPVVTGGLASGLMLVTNLDTVVTYRVSDSNGNPLAQGAMITVSALGDGASSVVLSGDVNVTLPDTRDTSFTKFSFRLRDTNSVITASRPLFVNIQVTGPNGTVMQQVADTLLGQPMRSVASLALLNISATELTVRDYLATEASLMTFELRDSINNPIAQEGVPIIFHRNGVPGWFTPETTMTDANGRVQTIFHSDTVAGVVRVWASTLTGSAVSPQQRMIIVGGKPDKDHFTFCLSRPADSVNCKLNFPGEYLVGQLIGGPWVLVGDRYGNTATPNTPIYFTTNAGVIGAVGYTNDSGFTSVPWYGGDPFPPGGIATVIASALDGNGLNIRDTITAVFSAQSMISGGPPNGFTIPGSGSVTFTYSVHDVNGNPVAAGNTIHIMASGTAASTVVMSGDVDVVMPDTRDPSATNFSFTVRDTSTFSPTNRDLRLTITVGGPNGSASTFADGTVTPTGSTGRTRLPASIALISISTRDVKVAGVGGTETSTMIWELRDSLGVPVDSAYRVRFSFSSSPGGGAFISPDSGLSDPATGRVSSIVHSGTVSGALQVLATVVSPTGTINSTPERIIINAGLPDQLHFTVGASPINVPGLFINGQTSTISVIVGDRYANPVAQSTAVYFTTTEGVVTTNTGFTDSMGRASVTFMSANPRSSDGFGYVIARTAGEGGVTVTDSVRILLSGSPIIDSISYNPTNVVDDSTSFTVRFRLYDVNHNPLAAGTNITIAIQGASAIASPVQPAAMLPDTQSPFYTVFTAVIAKDKTASPLVTGAFTGTIQVTGPNGSANANFTGQVQ